MSVEVISGGVETAEGRSGCKMHDQPNSASSAQGLGGNGLPIILGPRPERVYPHSLLLELKEHPLARMWPPYLDPVFKNQRGVWDPDRWHLDRKRGETPVMGNLDGKGELDPRDIGGRKDKRGMGDQDGEELQHLVLSPQRRSFLGGCSSGAGDGEVSLRPEQPGKRVGSGRILARQERERDDGERGFRRGDDFRRIPGERDRRVDDKFAGFRGRDRDEERDAWGDDRRRERDSYYQQHDDRDRRGGDRDMRGMQDRQNRVRRRQNEPEWMSESITKSDVIELRGFEEKKEANVEKEKESPTAALPISLSLGLSKPGHSGPPPGLPAGGISVEDLEREQRDKTVENNNNHQFTCVEKNSNLREQLNPSETTQAKINGDNNTEMLKTMGISNKQEEKPFNYDQIIESINISNLLGGAPGLPDPQAHVAPAAQSRFSQFFNRGVNEQKNQESRRSSIQDELVGAKILKEINGEEGPVIRIPSPGEEERYFAPISPAAQTRAVTNPLLDMINKGNGHGHRQVQEMEDGLKRSLGIGGQAGYPQMPHQLQQDGFKGSHPHGFNQTQRHIQGKENREHEPQQDNLSAFKKLVAMVGPQPESRDQAVPFGPNVVRPSPLPASLPSNAPTERDILEHMMTGGMPGLSMPQPKPPSLPPALANYLATHPLNTELLARPEAEQLIMGLNTGNITIENILQQLSNPALQQRQRDLLLSVLKLRTMNSGLGRGGSNLPPPLPPHLALPRNSPLPPNDPMMLLPQGAPPTRVSPLMFPHMAPPTHLSVSPSPQQARVPSPQEMTVLTQQIMQQALIKRKLEEQKENFRRRQGDPEQPVSTAPNTQTASAVSSSIVTSGSPLAFTPTSVMRKNAAERKDSDPQTRGLGAGAQVPELKVTAQKEGISRELNGQHPPPSPGRAITKGKEERPFTLDLGQVPPQGGRRLSPQQMPQHPVFPPNMQASMPHNNPLLYLQNNHMGQVNQSMISQANAMAQQQMAANFLAHGIDPRQVSNRIPPQQLQRPQCVSPSRSHPGPNLAPSPQPQTGHGALARFFSPEVLAQAQSGAVPAMPPMASLSSLHKQQKVLTLEEIERQAAAVRI